MTPDAIIEGGFRFLAYHDTLGGASSHVAHPENASRGAWVLLGLVVLVVVVVVYFAKQNKQK